MKMSQQLTEKRNALLARADEIVSAATAETRDLSIEEDAEIASTLSTVKDLDEQIKRHLDLEGRIDSVESRKANRVESAAVVVKSEARTYRPDGDHSFVADAYAAQFTGDYAAAERLARHMKEESVERRDVGTSAFAGLVVPQYLTDLAAPFARAGRPYADRVRKHALPAAGMTISISKVTTGSAVAEQTEGDAVQETNMDDTKLDLSVKTIAGQQNVSRQALERGTGIDALVMADLVSAYHTKLDGLVVANLEGDSDINSVTYTDASPTVGELYPKILDAVQKIQTNFYAGPNFILMHPRRLAWILAALDTTNRPLAVPSPNGPMNAIASSDSGVVYGNSGYSIAGFPVITDANLATNGGAGTNQDAIYVGNLQEAHLFEQGGGAPFMLRFEQPKSAELEVKMVVYGYAAYTHNRYPKAFASITGTGLVTPTF